MTKNFEYTTKCIFLISLLLFSLNQISEFVILYELGDSYANLCKWDCLHYKSLVEKGYDVENAILNLVFFPILPYLAKFVSWLTNLSAELSLIVVGKIFFLLAIFSFIKLSQIYLPKVSPLFSGFIVTFSPYQIYGNSGYTESIFLFLTCASFILLKKNRYVASGISGAVLSASRVYGIFFALSYFVFHLRNFRKNLRIEILLGLLLIPLGLACFMMFIFFKTGDALAILHIQNVGWEHPVVDPFTRIIENIAIRTNEPGFYSVIPYYVITGIVAIIISLILAWKKKYELALFPLSSILFTLLFAVCSMPRYVWWQAPILLFIVEITSLRKNISVLTLPIFYLSSITVEVLWLNNEVQFLI